MVGYIELRSWPHRAGIARVVDGVGRSSGGYGATVDETGSGKPVHGRAPRAREIVMDPIRELPYGPAACDCAASEAGYMSAPDHALRSFEDSSCTGGGVHTCP